MVNQTTKTQKQKIFDLLKSRAGKWIPAYEIASLALQYGTRISELRESGAIIRNRDEWHQGKRLTWFMLEESRLIPKPQPSETPLLFQNIPERHRDDG